jgi:mannose-6-phosphate isomerase-like protein (cupin superfamily)
MMPSEEATRSYDQFPFTPRRRKGVPRGSTHFEVTTQPEAGLPPRVQHSEEAYFVLEGEYELLVEGEPL